ncbi:MAG TPA: hypothetical protein VFK85_06870 [Anaeromyxobacteraceae bacterium]|nr:hypothetical protein [Anaeromyxobacteraceae bacterium]
MKHLHRLAVAVMLLGAASAARATPSTVVWAPSTTYTQPFLVPHLTYDTYFRRDASYPTTVGLTMGVLPSDVVQAEVGFDLLYPSNDPLVLNGKVTLLEDKLFKFQPGLSIGVANAGITAATNFAMVYGILSKTVPGVGATLSAGIGYGLDDKLWVDENGKADQTMFIGSVTSPTLNVGQPWLSGLGLAADVQTGRNAFSAAGVAGVLYFTPSVALLTGPVFFLNRDTQPNRSDFMWTMQIDVDIPSLVSKKK